MEFNDKHNELPEGIQVTIEILQNIPESMLNDFIMDVNDNFDQTSTTKDIWDMVVLKQYNK